MTILADRLIAADQGEAALAVWNDLRRLTTPSAERLFNANFTSHPSGHGFDWRMTPPQGGSATWTPARLRFSLTGSTPDACRLLDQWAVLTAGRYGLRLEYRTDGLAAATGLRWVLLRRDRVEASGPMLAQQLQPASRAQISDWSFLVPRQGLYDLQLVYVRVPGTTHGEGTAEFSSVLLEKL